VNVPFLELSRGVGALRGELEARDAEAEVVVKALRV